MTNQKQELTPIHQLPDFKKRLATLTEKERLYFSIMRGQLGVLYIKAKPGVGKSAIAASIAEKMGLRYIDIRLSMADETDMQFPNLTLHEDLNVHVIEHAIPQWAAISNKQPSLIHFEELNRAPLAVRNAALQILLERAIGPEFRFNENVFMMASGNLGEEDGTDVEEFDAALNNRLLPFNHDLKNSEWLEWAEGKIHPDIRKFIEFQENNLYIPPNDNSQQYATPRSWHMLSQNIVRNFGGGPKLDENGNFLTDDKGNVLHFYDGYKLDQKGEVIFETLGSKKDNDSFYITEKVRDDNGGERTVYKYPVRNWSELHEYQGFVERTSVSFVGETAAMKFVKWVNDRTRVTLKDVLKDYGKVKNDLKSFTRDKFSELITEAKSAEIDKWGDKEIRNYADFLKECQADERVGFLLYMIDNVSSRFSGGIKSPSIRKLLKEFPEDLKRIRERNKGNRK
jgi:hypothetical protein